MAFSSSLVTGGRGLGVVTATGSTTEIGRINTMIGEVETLATPLTRQMTAFGKQLSVAIVGFAAVVVLIGLVLHDYPVTELLLAAIGFSVAAIPEGLPAILTITLAIGVQRMARSNAITRRLNAVETLGSVTVICSDKTGTLTQNEMTARRVVTSRNRYEVSGTGYEPRGAVHLGDAVASVEDHADLAALVEAMAVANDSDVVEHHGRWTVDGEPTEGALQTLALKAGFDPAGYERRAVVPFESEHKMMATLDETRDGRSVVLVKGAPDRLLDLSTSELTADGTSGELRRDWWDRQVDELGSEGLRVLAAARREPMGGDHELTLEEVHDLQFLGLVGIVDPPRPEAIDAVEACRRAGITVKMITGDHAGTAVSIGRELGIGDGERAITGTEIEAASDEALQDLVHRHDVFARTSPEHKLRLVKALQAGNEVVAMTGDGVNDAPALKRADVGVAMGIKGTEATKEAAEIVLADDNFASIARAVEEGRTIYDNLRKSILFILPTNAAQALVIVTAIVLGLDLPLTPTQILWVNMVTAVTLALALAFEPAEPDIMGRPPRTPGRSILDRFFLWRIGFVGVLVGGATIAVFLLADRGADDLDTARTLAVTTLVLSQVFYLFNSRFLREASFPIARVISNRIAWAMVGVLILLQLGFVYLPFMNTLFHTAPLDGRQWLIAAAIGLTIFIIVEVEKVGLRTRARRRSLASDRPGTTD
jgi:potassium/sodium efflux P-type ATPase